MQVGIFAKTFAGTNPWEVLRAARAAGYEAVQYNMACSGLDALPSAISAEAAKAVHAASVATGVTIAAVSATYNMIHPDPAVRAQGRSSFAAIAAAAPQMGTRLLTVCTGTRDPDDQWRRHPDNAGAAAWDDLCAECALLLEIAQRHDIAIGVEPEPGNVVDSTRRALALIETFGSARLHIVLDPANLSELASPEQRRALVEEAVAVLHAHLALAHAKDRAADGTVVAAGIGEVDFPHFLACLRRAGFDGPVITHGLAAADAARTATYLRTALISAARVR